MVRESCFPSVSWVLAPDRAKRCGRWPVPRRRESTPVMGKGLPARKCRGDLSRPSQPPARARLVNIVSPGFAVYAKFAESPVDVRPPGERHGCAYPCRDHDSNPRIHVAGVGDHGAAAGPADRSGWSKCGVVRRRRLLLPTGGQLAALVDQGDELRVGSGNVISGDLAPRPVASECWLAGLAGLAGLVAVADASDGDDPVRLWMAAV